MNPQVPTGENSTKPVAYDHYGRPLYAHPPEVPQPTTPEAAPAATPSQDPNTPQVVYLSRAIDPHHQEISPEVQQKHTESMRKYPHLNLSEGEFVISAIKRHPIGIISIWSIVILALVIVIVLPASLLVAGFSPIVFSGEALANGGFMLLLLAILIVLAGIVATVVYDANRFYLTNESVIQHIQMSLFSKKDQTISLGNVEDASYRQKGIVQTLLSYGSIRLSTEGEETTYRFNFVHDPQEQIRRINNAVESFKNYRPIDTGTGNDD